MTPFYEFVATHLMDCGSDPAITRTATRHDLCLLFAAMGYRTGAEIGTWIGLFAEEMCLANPGVQLTCVDPWLQYDTYRERKNNQQRLDESYKEACARLKPFGCRILRMTSVEAAALVPDGSLDYAYLDANHARAFVEQDLAAWLPKVRSGGIIAGHDFELPPRKAPWIDVREAVIAWTKAHHVSPWYVLARESKAPSWFWRVP